MILIKSKLVNANVLPENIIVQKMTNILLVPMMNTSIFLV